MSFCKPEQCFSSVQLASKCSLTLSITINARNHAVIRDVRFVAISPI